MTESTFQQLCQDWCNRHILYDQTTLVSRLFELEQFDWDDVENLYRPVEGQYKLSYIHYEVTNENNDVVFTLPQEWRDRIDNTKDLGSETEELLRMLKLDRIIPDYITEFVDEGDDFETEPVEVYHWLLVDSHAAHWLYKKGEPLLENHFGTWWGRTTSGQSYIIDDVVKLFLKFP